MEEESSSSSKQDAYVNDCVSTFLQMQKIKKLSYKMLTKSIMKMNTKENYSGCRRRYRSAIEIKDPKGDQKGQGGDRRNSDSRDNAGLRGRRSSEDRRASTSRDRRNSNDKDRRTETFIEEGFLQICGPTEHREMQEIQDILYPLEESPYKLQCTCQHCLSYSYEVTSPDKTYIEPFMRAINLIFSQISKYGFTLQSTSSVQNADNSSTTTWVWVRVPVPELCDPTNEHTQCKKEEEDNRPRRKY